MGFTIISMLIRGYEDKISVGRAIEMDELVMTIASNIDDLNLIPQTYMTEVES